MSAQPAFSTPPSRPGSGRSGWGAAAIVLAVVLPMAVLLGWVGVRLVDAARPDPPATTVSADVTLRPETGGTRVTVDLRTLSGVLPERLDLHLIRCDCPAPVAGRRAPTGEYVDLTVEDAAGRVLGSSGPSTSVRFTLPRQDPHLARFSYWMPLVQGRRVILPQPWTSDGGQLAVRRVRVTGIAPEQLSCQDTPSTFAHTCTVTADGTVTPDGDYPLTPIRLEQLP